MTLREQLLMIVDLYCASSGRSEASVATQLLSGGRRIQQIRNGGDIGTIAFERVMLWFSINWPDGVGWPCEVVRPSHELAEATE